MISIRKGKEPDELLEYRMNKGATYQDMHGAPTRNPSGKDVYTIVLESLIQEQGGLCAYCMKKIPQKGKMPGATIEHMIPQAASDTETGLDYRNMVAVCNGNRDSSDNLEKTCDAKRGTYKIERQKLYINPLDLSSLLDISYKDDGTISSPDANKAMNINETLNLNYTVLKENRRSALNGMIKEIYRRYQSGEAGKIYLQHIFEKYNTASQKEAYVGILLYWLKKRIDRAR